MFRYNYRKYLTTISCLVVFLMYPDSLYAQEDIRCNIYLVGDCPPNYYAQQLKNSERLKKGLEEIMTIFEHIPDVVPELSILGGYLRTGIDHDIKAANELAEGQNAGLDEADAAYSPGGIDTMNKLNDAKLCDIGIKSACRH